MKYSITGSSMITSIGRNRDECFKALCDLKKGNGRLKYFDSTRYKNKIAFEIDDRPAGGKDSSLRATNWLVNVIQDAIHEAKLDMKSARLAVMVGTGLRELRSFELWNSEKSDFSVEHLHFESKIIKNLLPHCHVITISNACSASSFCLGMAMDILDMGHYDAVIAAGTDSITESMFGLLDKVNPYSPVDVQPFDNDRLGMIMGEGAAAVVIERTPKNLDSCVSVLGVGMSCDAKQETAPSREGLIRAMRDAYRRSGVTPDDIDLIIAHGTGTALNDKTEMEAIKEVFGSNSGILVSGNKSNMGHTSGASGLVSVVSAIEILNNSKIPPIVGLKNLIPEAEGVDVVMSHTREKKIKLVQINAFGFGGVNAVVVLRRED